MLYKPHFLLEKFIFDALVQYLDEVQNSWESIRVTVTWLEDPGPYQYLRKTRYTRGSRRGFKKTSKILLGDFYKVLGYELIGRSGIGWFDYWIYWLKTYDAGCPQAIDAYKKSGQPTEAVEVKELLKNNPYPTRDAKKPPMST